MSFRFNDYNAFLTSLFYKDFNNVDADRENWRIEGIPVNFEAGIMGNSEAPDPKRWDSTCPGTEFIAEVGAYGNPDGEAKFRMSEMREGKNACSDPVRVQGDVLPDQKPEIQFNSIYADPFDGHNPKLGDLIPNGVDMSRNLVDDRVKRESFCEPSGQPIPDEAMSRPRARSSHNVIEQRYRNKINDKFNALQNSVPSLRVVAKKRGKSLSSALGDQRNYEYDDDEEEEMLSQISETEEDLEGLEPAKKLNKGIILSKSVEYIRFLERKNAKIRSENELLMKQAAILGINITKYKNAGSI